MKKKSKKGYFSNTLAGGGNQFIFINPNYKSGGVSRIFYKVTAGGEYNYVTKWSCVIDSTYADGSVSKANTVLDGFNILGLKMAVCKEVNNEIPDTSFVKATFDITVSTMNSNHRPTAFFRPTPKNFSNLKTSLLYFKIAFTQFLSPIL